MAPTLHSSDTISKDRRVLNVWRAIRRGEKNKQTNRTSPWRIKANTEACITQRKEFERVLLMAKAELHCVERQLLKSVAGKLPLMRPSLRRERQLFHSSGDEGVLEEGEGETGPLVRYQMCVKRRKASNLM